MSAKEDDHASTWFGVCGRLGSLTSVMEMCPMWGCTMSIEEVLVEIESRRFVGRASELQALSSLVQRSVTEATVGYVYGPPGVGKTALLRALGRMAEGEMKYRRILLEVHRIGLDPGAFFRATASSLDMSRNESCGPDAVTVVVQDLARTTGVLLLIDDYDMLGDEEAAIRERLLYRLPPGSAVVLTGRRTPSALWPLERAWRHYVTQIPLANLPTHEAEELFNAHGILDPSVREEAYAVTAGRPSLLAHVTDLLSLDEVAAAAENDRALPHLPTAQAADLGAYLIEQLLHPGSRRRSWRPGTGAPKLDLAVAAASTVPSFNRELLTAMVGHEVVAGAWEYLHQLPISADSHGWLHLSPGLKERVAQVVRRQRPWISRVWSRRALAHCLMGEGSRSDQQTKVVGLQIWATVAGPWADTHSGLAGEMVLTRGSLPKGLVERSLPGQELLRQLSERAPERFVSVQDRRGRLLAGAVALPAAEVPEDVMPRNAVRERTLAVIVAAEEQAALGPIVGELGAMFRDCDVVLARGIGCRGDVFAQIGFSPDSEGASDWWRLDLHACPFDAWLRQLAAPLLAIPEPPDPSAIAKEVLQAFSSGLDIGRTEVGRALLDGPWSVRRADVRKWVLDALQSADLGEIPCSGRMLLKMYYVDRIGSHEEIAERLNLPRATYFRTYRQALTQFGNALVGIVA